MGAVREALERGVPGVLGIHVEGPFLNQRHRGIHPTARLCQVNDEWIELLASLRGGRTLAPEVAGLETVRCLHRAGVKVAIGHSKADFATAGAAFAAGASGVTHLFNGM